MNSSLNINHKVVLLGETRSGKTSILSRLLTNNFSENYYATIGTGIGIWNTITGPDQIQLQIWDTAGQETYKSLGTIFFRNAEAGILVFSLENDFSEDNANDWVKRFKDVAHENSIIFIVANKCDISIEKFEIIKSWADLKGYISILTSAKTGENILKLFKLVACEIFSKNSLSSKISKAVNLECSSKCETCC